MKAIRRDTINALLKEDSMVKFAEMAAQDLADIWHLGHDGNRNHQRTWRAARRDLRVAIERKCDVYYPGWREGSIITNPDRSEQQRENWLKGFSYRDQVLKDILDMADLIQNAEAA